MKVEIIVLEVQEVVELAQHVVVRQPLIPVVVEAGHPVGLAVPVSVVQQNQQVIRPVAQSRIREAVVLVTADIVAQRRMRTVRAAMERQAS